MALTFTNHFPIGERRPVTPIGKCQAMLPNRMQCTKAETWTVSDDSTDPPTVYHYCHYHAQLVKQASEQQAQQTIKEEKGIENGISTNDPSTDPTTS